MSRNLLLGLLLQRFFIFSISIVFESKWCIHDVSAISFGGIGGDTRAFITIRGGYSDYYDDEEQYDDDIYDNDEPNSASKFSSSPHRPRGPRVSEKRRKMTSRHPDHHRIPQPRQQNRRGPPPSPSPLHNQHNRRRRKQRPSPSSQKTKATEVLDKTKDIAQKSLNFATTATISTIKTSGKAAYYLTAPRFVSRNEIHGIWRLDQSIGSSACAANIELRPNGNVITRYEGEERVYGYLFQSRKWPRSCTIEFQSEAFQGPSDEVPILYYYKGYFRRKMADKNVIKIVGKIYEVKRNRFGKGSRPGAEIGEFVARRRMTTTAAGVKNNQRHTNDIDDEEYDEDEYFDEGEYDYDDEGYNDDYYDENNYD